MTEEKLYNDEAMQQVTESVETSVTEPMEASVTESVEASFREASSTSKIVDSDLDSLRADFSELSDLESISQLPNPTRYAALRDLGLTPGEAYMATGRVARESTKSHLTTSVPKAASVPYGAMTRQQLSEAREIFGNLSDVEIQKLYKRVNN